MDSASDSPPEERGRTTIAERVVERIAGQIVARCVAVGGTSNRVLGFTVGEAGQDTGAELTARLHGQRAVSFAVRCSVPYPASVREATAAVRAELTERIAELTGMTVRRVDITVTALTTMSGRRVQ